MDTYIYNAAFYCGPCGEKIANDPKVIAERDIVFPAYDSADEYTWDSGVFPKGPYDSTYDESDCPDHCDACSVFLENPLTDDGYEYVKDAIRNENDQFGGVNHVVRGWADFYDLAV